MLSRIKDLCARFFVRRNLCAAQVAAAAAEEEETMAGAATTAQAATTAEAAGAISVEAGAGAGTAAGLATLTPTGAAGRTARRCKGRARIRRTCLSQRSTRTRTAGLLRPGETWGAFGRRVSVHGGGGAVVLWLCLPCCVLWRVWVLN